MIELFTTAFITLAVIIDPPGCAPIFASLTAGTDAAHRRKMAIRSAAVAWCILLFFALLVSYLGYTAWYNLVPAVRRWEDRPDDVDELERSEPSGAEQVGA